MKRIILTQFLILIMFKCWSQDVYSHQFSSVPDNARYEIIQSERGARYTLKINKYSGQVFQMVLKEDTDLTWEPIMILEKFTKEETTDGKVNFQVFISGLGARFIFLLQINTGKTWQLAEDTDSGLNFWKLIE